MSAKKCKYCAAIIPVEASICPLCGKKEGWSLFTKIFVIVGCLILVGVIILAVMTGSRENRVTTISDTDATQSLQRLQEAKKAIYAVDIYPAKEFRVNTGAMLIILDKMQTASKNNNNVPNSEVKALWISLGTILNSYVPLPKKTRGAQSDILNEFHTIYINYASWLPSNNPVQSLGAVEIIGEHHKKVKKLCADYNYKTKGKN